MKNRKILKFFAVLLIVSFSMQTSAFATPITKDSLVYSKVAVLHTNPLIGDVESNLLNLKNLIKQQLDDIRQLAIDYKGYIVSIRNR